MFDHIERRTGILAFAAALMMVLGAFAVLTIDGSDATGADLSGYGEVNEITIAPGYSWSYTAKFPSDLESGVVLSFEQNELTGIATISGLTLSVNGITSTHAGNSYNIVLKATHADSGQTSYQWIRITVNQAMSVNHSGCIDEIISGASQTINLLSEGGIGTVTWSEVSSLPAGLTLIGSTISGVPTTIGTNIIQVRATSTVNGEAQQTMDVEITFTVFNVIVGGADEVVDASNHYAASSAITQTGNDLNVKWTTTDALPAGFSLDASTGVISGTYTGSTAGSHVINLTGTAQNGPSQTASKKVTINVEPTFSISGDSSIKTYTGNADVTSQFSIGQSTSTITWSITSLAGVSISQTGLVTVSGTAAVTDSTSLTVTARSAYGQTQTKVIDLMVEDTLSISGASRLVSYQNKAASIDITVTGGSSNTVQIADYSGISDTALTYADGKLGIASAGTISSTTVTLTVTSAAGQTDTMDVEVVVYSALGFTSAPGAAGIFAFVKG